MANKKRLLGNAIIIIGAIVLFVKDQDISGLRIIVAINLMLIGFAIWLLGKDKNKS